MNNSSRPLQTPLDSLDIHQQQFNRSRIYKPQQREQQNQFVFKNFYKQQLDDLLNKKNKNKILQKQKQQQQKILYNQRLKLQQQAQKIKQISYKNYYQMIMNNQQNLKNKYINPYKQKDQERNNLINKYYEQGKIKSQIQYEKQQRRQQNLKKQLQNVLYHQVNQKQYNNKITQQQKYKNNQHLRNILLTPQQIQHIQRQRKISQMSKYKQDLDKLTQQKLHLSRATNNPEHNNNHSPRKTQKHDLLLNPLPYNIQNPYIIKQMQRRNIINTNNSNYNYQTIPNQPYSPISNSQKNIFG